jgi:hypothetical protein
MSPVSRPSLYEIMSDAILILTILSQRSFQAAEGLIGFIFAELRRLAVSEMSRNGMAAMGGIPTQNLKIALISSRLPSQRAAFLTRLTGKYNHG